MAPRETTELTAPHKAFATMCVVIALWLRSRLNFNSAYMDESDYLFVGRRLLSGETWPSKEYIFSSDLPLLALGFGESLGGLVGARSVSLILGIISLVLYLLFVRALNLGAGVAMLATALFAIASPHVNISKLATYDSMCLALFTGSAWLVAHILSSEEKGQRTARLALVASFLMALAILSKYVAALYAPIFGLALVRHHPIAGALPSAAILSGYCLTHREALKRLYEIQISGVHGPNSSSVELLATFGLYCGLPLLGGITSLWIGRGGSREMPRTIRIALLLCAAPLVAYHIHSLNRIAFHKHLVFALFFLLPLAARSLMDATAGSRRPVPAPAALVAWACALAFVALNVHQLGQLEAGYPNTERLEGATLSRLTSNTTLLSEDPYLFRYLARGRPLDAFSETSHFDLNGDGTAEEIELLTAVEEGRFDFIVLNDQVTPRLSELLRKGPLERHYELIFDQPYVTTRAVSSLNRGSLALYRRHRAKAKTEDS